MVGRLRPTPACAGTTTVASSRRGPPTCVSDSWRRGGQLPWCTVPLLDRRPCGAPGASRRAATVGPRHDRRGSGLLLAPTRRRSRPPPRPPSCSTSTSTPASSARRRPAGPSSSPRATSSIDTAGPPVRVPSIWRTLVSWALMLSRRWVAAASSRSDSARIRAAGLRGLADDRRRPAARPPRRSGGSRAAPRRSSSPRWCASLDVAPRARPGCLASCIWVVKSSSARAAGAGQRGLEVGGGLGGLGALLLVDGLGLLQARGGVALGAVERGRRRCARVLEHPGRLGVGVAAPLVGVAVGLAALRRRLVADLARAPGRAGRGPARRRSWASSSASESICAMRSPRCSYVAGSAGCSAAPAACAARAPQPARRAAPRARAPPRTAGSGPRVACRPGRARSRAGPPGTRGRCVLVAHRWCFLLVGGGRRPGRPGLG